MSTLRSLSLSSKSIRMGSLRPTIINIGGCSLAFLGIFEKDDDVPPEDKIVLHIKKAILAMQQDDYETAEENLALAFHLSRKHGFQDALTQVVDYQANLALKRGYFARAESLFKFLSQRLVNLGKAKVTDNCFVEISIKIAEIYAQTRRLDEAMSGFQHCVIAQRQKIDAGADDEDTLVLAAWALHNLSQVYIRLGVPDNKNDPHLAKAVYCLREAYSYVFKALGPEAQQSVAIMSDLATGMALQGQHTAAFKIFEEIGNIARDKHTDLYPGIKVNVGNMHLQKSEFVQANKVCLEAKDLATKSKDMDALRRAEECLLKSLDGQRKVESEVG